MDREEVERKIGALKAIIQTLVPDVYSHDEEEALAFFQQSVQDADPVAMCITNELDKDEIVHAFAWGGSKYESVTAELETMPVSAHLEPNQRNHALVGLAALEAADIALETATQMPEPAGRRRMSTRERIQIGEEVFVFEMTKQMVKHEGKQVDLFEKTLLNKLIDNLPEPWKGETKKGIWRLGQRITMAIENMDD